MANNNLLQSSVGRLRILGWLEGITLLVLLVVAVPLKYFLHEPKWVQMLGPVHGVAFLLFLFNTLSVGVKHAWTFSGTTWKVIAACFIPFGTFYIDWKILRHLPA
jgi:integral membrane protein